MTKQFFGRSSSLLLMIFYKLLLAAIQVLAGAMCLVVGFFLKHPAIIKAIDSIPNKDRLDLAVHWTVSRLVEWRLDHSTVVNIGLILIAFGLFSAIVAGGLWFKSSKMRLLALVVFGALALYTIYQLILNFSTIQTIVLAVNLYIIYYFWKILPKHLEN